MSGGCLERGRRHEFKNQPRGANQLIGGRWRASRWALCWQTQRILSLARRQQASGGGEGTHLWSLPFPQDFFFFFFNSQQAGYGQKLLPVAISAVDKLKLDGVDAALVSSSV